MAKNTNDTRDNNLTNPEDEKIVVDDNVINTGNDNSCNPRLVGILVSQADLMIKLYLD